MTDKGMFKKRLFGFKKKQVLEYIYDLTSVHKAEMDEMAEKVAAAEERTREAEKRIEELLEKLNDSRAEYENTLNILQGVTDECAEYKSRCENLKAKVFYFTSRKEAVDREIDAAREYAVKIKAEAKQKADAIINESREYTKTVEANVELIKRDAEEIRLEIRESLEKLEDSLVKLGAVGDKPRTIPTAQHKEKKSSSGILQEIKNIFRGVGY